MPTTKPSSASRLKKKLVSLYLDPPQRDALVAVGKSMQRTQQSLLREGVEYVLSRYIPVEIKAVPRAAPREDDAPHSERRAVKRVPTLTDLIDTPAAHAATAVRAAYVAQSLAPNDPKTLALTKAAVTIAARHGFIVRKKATLP